MKEGGCGGWGGRQHVTLLMRRTTLITHACAPQRPARRKEESVRAPDEKEFPTRDALWQYSKYRHGSSGAAVAYALSRATGLRSATLDPRARLRCSVAARPKPASATRSVHLRRRLRLRRVVRVHALQLAADADRVDTVVAPGEPLPLLQPLETLLRLARTHPVGRAQIAADARRLLRLDRAVVLVAGHLAEQPVEKLLLLGAQAGRELRRRVVAHVDEAVVDLLVGLATAFGHLHRERIEQL
mmetsp:Transcript_6220/g.16347  ORF Transcript_6220/g.16347 Transcript_6220/m.16347 type:complete len:243 (-) Transcript_6220:232-960(-)